jgi:predicted DNA-binding transcriptional regulator AlpA
MKLDTTQIDNKAPCYRYIRLPEVTQLVPFSQATIWRKVKNGEFPRPVKLSSRITAWPRAAVIAWIAEKGAE